VTDPIDSNVVRVRFSRLPFSKSWIQLIWREAQDWPRHSIRWEIFLDNRPSYVLPPQMRPPGAVRTGLASLAPLGFFVDGSYD